MTTGIRRTIAIAATAALAAGGASAFAGDDGGYRGGDGRSNDVKDREAFATVKYPQGQTLVLFGGKDRREVAVQGLAPGERIVGIDVRPANNRLYGVSSANRSFAIDTGTGAISNVQTLSVPLQGQFFGVDFNPSVDRIRITSDTEQNLRANPDTGATVADGPLAYPAGDRNAGRDPGAVHDGYTFAPLGGATALRDVDANTDTFVLQNPPNAGALNSIGPVGIDVGLQGGFDIAGTQTFTALGFFQQGDVARLYELRFDRNGQAVPTGLELKGQYDGFAVLNAYADDRRR